jgi:hypothetical protein
MVTARLLLTYKLTPFLHAIAQITLFEAAVNDHTRWTFAKVPPPEPLSTTPNTRSLSDVKLCTELYGENGRPSIPEDPDVMQLAAWKNKGWTPGCTLSVYFVGGDSDVHERVRLSSISHWRKNLSQTKRP